MIEALDEPFHIAVSDTALYWIADGTVRVCDKYTGGNPTDLGAHGRAETVDIKIVRERSGIYIYVVYHLIKIVRERSGTCIYIYIYIF